ncbi:MAG: tetratricopeptide repeat protein [Candidatus Saccharibacteria bacterium]|nr:tetratricopeptide repeat protein [Rhodoferax sp.]
MGFLSKLFSGSKSAGKGDVVVPIGTAGSGPPGTSKYLQLKQEANGFLDQGKLEEAAQVYRAAVAENPALSEAHLNLAYVLGELKNNAEAKLHFAQALAFDNDNFDAHYLSALLAIDEDDTEQAILFSINALRVKPSSSEATATLYKVLALRGEFGKIEERIESLSNVNENPAKVQVDIACTFATMACQGALRETLNQMALKHFEAAIELDDSYIHTFTNQGLLLMVMGQHDAAIDNFRRAIFVNPSFAEAYYYLAIVCQTTHRMEAALENIIKAISINPDHADSYTILADINWRLGKFEESVFAYKISIEKSPASVDAYMRLSGLLAELGLHDEALDTVHKAVKIRGDSPEVYYALGNIYLANSQYRDAIKVYQRALQLRPAYPEVNANLGAAFLGAGDTQKAREIYFAITKLDSRNKGALGNIVYCSSFDPACTSDSYLNHARAYGAVLTELAKPYTSWPRAEIAGRCLKVGLVSGDFIFHPVGFFIESVLAFLDPDKIEIHAFSNRTKGDQLQTSLKSRVCSWNLIAGLSDELAAKLIYEKQLDLLIDLTGHTNHNRLPLFAWRPAPVQATWLGYWASTGVAEIDYIIADRQAVPPEHQSQFTEKVWYLPDTRLCFTPLSAVYDLLVSPLPATRLGYVTFGCYQPIRKLTEQIFALWGRIYQQLPQARFRLQGADFNKPEISAELLTRLARVGIPAHRVMLRDSTMRFEYLHSHAEVDILLDSFPYPGGTTTCDALWMGVPTVTLAGNTMLSRQGLSLLRCAGLPDWVAETEDEYVAIAVNKASDLPRLRQFRASLRQQVFDSPLFDAPRFARNMEAALLAMVLDKLGSLPS